MDSHKSKKQSIIKLAPNIKKIRKKRLVNVRVLISRNDVHKCRYYVKGHDSMDVDDEPRVCKCPYKPLAKTYENFVVPPHITEPLTLYCKKQDENNEIITKRWYAGIEFILGRHYYDVCARLKLDHASDCVYDHMNRCRKHKQREKELFSSADDIEGYDLVFLSVNTDQSRCLKRIEKMLIQGVFPGSILMKLLIDLMLFLYKPFTEWGKEINMTQLIHRSIAMLIQILDLYPICVEYYRSQYKTIICGLPVIDRRFYPKTYEDHMFNFIISTLKHLMTSPADPNCDDDNDKENDYSDSEEEDSEKQLEYVSWYDWEAQEEKKVFNFDKLSRKKKIQRLFYVLQLIVMICERDLSIFILRYPRYPKAAFETEKSRPILAFILWTECKEIGIVNSLIREVLECYVHAVYLSFPKKDIAVLSQLLNLICFCVEASEVESESTSKDGENTLYPDKFWNGGLLTIRFAKEMRCIIEDHPNISTACTLEILQHLKSPLMKHMLADFMLNRYFTSVEEPTAIKFYRKFMEEEWRKCDSDPQPYNDMEIDTDHYNPVHYPAKDSIPKRTQVEKQKITQAQYIAMSLICFEGYLEVYRMHEFIELMKCPADSDQLKTVIQTGFFSQTNNNNHENITETLPKGNCIGENLPISELYRRNYFFNGIKVSKEILIDIYRKEAKYCILFAKTIAAKYEMDPVKLAAYKTLTHQLCTH